TASDNKPIADRIAYMAQQDLLIWQLVVYVFNLPLYILPG
ncbi:unnamed protein product, partial [marine sediment metagenome]